MSIMSIMSIMTQTTFRYIENYKRKWIFHETETAKKRNENIYL